MAPKQRFSSRDQSQGVHFLNATLQVVIGAQTVLFLVSCWRTSHDPLSAVPNAARRPCELLRPSDRVESVLCVPP